MGEDDPGGALHRRRLVVPHPAHLGRGDGGQRHHPDRLGPRLRPTQLVDEVVRGAGRAGVVPQQGGTDHLVGVVEQHHAVLLPPDREGADTVEQPARRRLLEGPPPVRRVDLGGVRMGAAAHPDDFTGARVAHRDLAGLGRGVDPGDERSVGHARCLRGWRRPWVISGQPMPGSVRAPGLSGPSGRRTAPPGGPSSGGPPRRRSPGRPRPRRPASPRPWPARCAGRARGPAPA